MAATQEKHQGPRAGGLKYRIGKAWMAAAGWHVEGKLPEGTKGILIAAPHTSSWDLPYMLAVAWVFRLKLNWIGKRQLFEGKLTGPFFKALGGVPIDRHARKGAVSQIAQRFAEADELMLSIAPMGTRKKTDHWKSGFYHMAAEAQVPIICGFLDFKNKVGGVGPSIVPCGDMKKDMDAIRAFYNAIGARYPERLSTIRLRDEPEVDTAADTSAKGKLVADSKASSRNDEGFATASTPSGAEVQPPAAMAAS